MEFGAQLAPEQRKLAGRTLGRVLAPSNLKLAANHRNGQLAKPPNCQFQPVSQDSKTLAIELLSRTRTQAHERTHAQAHSSERTTPPATLSGGNISLRISAGNGAHTRCIGHTRNFPRKGGTYAT